MSRILFIIEMESPSRRAGSLASGSIRVAAVKSVVRGQVQEQPPVGSDCDTRGLSDCPFAPPRDSESALNLNLGDAVTGRALGPRAGRGQA